jgi:hypothetical protein
VPPAVSRRRAALELAVCTAVVAVLALHALQRMDYVGDHAQHIRMTDASRTAYVAKNIVEGTGYKTNDLPAALVDFYDQRGKLHDAEWVNADRFPFGAYATALLYEVTRSTSWEIGVLAYNLIFFVGFLVLLYWTASSIWSDRYAGLFAVAIAMVHPYTYMFLYWKDGDMLLLTTACMALLVRYYRAPPGTLSRRLAIGLGSVLAFLFLARPNLGAAFLLFVGASILRRLWSSRRQLGTGGALRHHLSRELLIPLTVLVWCTPFMIHSMIEWGQPLFSANNLYQLPLGTRYGMGTDTWWKYTEPGQLPTFGMLAERAGGELVAKFTSSWAATLKHVFGSYAFELLLGCGLFALLSARSGPDAERYRQQVRPVALVIVFAVVTNLLLLPLYSYQSYSFRHYLAFALPLLWIGAGRAVSLIGEQLRPVFSTIREHVGAHTRWYVLALAVAVLAWNLGTSTQDDQPRFFARTGAFIGGHWLAALMVLVAVGFRRQLLRPPWFPRVAVVMFSLVYSCYRPNAAMKRTNFWWFPADDKVWTSMRERKGIVSSFALQGEVAWNTGRRSIPAPEWPMHLYSFRFDHELEIEDVYIESANAMVTEGAFAEAAPGFEGYARLQEHRTLPGYEVAFHGQAMRGYPKFRIQPLFKASTVFKLVDPAAADAIRHSPDRIVVGDPGQVIYAAHGWDHYYVRDGKPVVVGTDVTRLRYEHAPHGPYEDSSITFFLEPSRSPKAVELEFYAAHPTSFQFFWNLDLYAYDRAKDRSAHRVGAHAVDAPGWQKVRLEIPPQLLKKGLNKLGFRAEAFATGVMCPKAFADDACVNALLASTPASEIKSPPRAIRADDVAEIQFHHASLFAHALQFIY